MSYEDRTLDALADDLLRERETFVLRIGPNKYLPFVVDGHIPVVLDWTVGKYVDQFNGGTTGQMANLAALVASTTLPRVAAPTASSFVQAFLPGFTTISGIQSIFYQLKKKEIQQCFFGLAPSGTKLWTLMSPSGGYQDGLNQAITPYSNNIIDVGGITGYASPKYAPSGRSMFWALDGVSPSFSIQNMLPYLTFPEVRFVVNRLFVEALTDPRDIAAAFASNKGFRTVGSPFADQSESVVMSSYPGLKVYDRKGRLAPDSADSVALTGARRVA